MITTGPPIAGFLVRKDGSLTPIDDVEATRQALKNEAQVLLDNLERFIKQLLAERGNDERESKTRWD